MLEAGSTAGCDPGEQSLGVHARSWAGVGPGRLLLLLGEQRPSPGAAHQAVRSASALLLSVGARGKSLPRHMFLGGSARTT